MPEREHAARRYARLPALSLRTLGDFCALLSWYALLLLAALALAPWLLP